jgi:hypothetical protein
MLWSTVEVLLLLQAMAGVAVYAWNHIPHP